MNWNQLPADLLASFSCKLNTFRKRVKKLLQVNQLGTECKYLHILCCLCDYFYTFYFIAFMFYHILLLFSCSVASLSWSLLG
jgi:hypothetical protein